MFCFSIFCPFFIISAHSADRMNCPGCCGAFKFHTLSFHMLNLGKITYFFYHHICIALHLSTFNFIRCPLAVQLISESCQKATEYTHYSFICIITRPFIPLVSKHMLSSLSYSLFSEAFN